jgi:hypothetical protein
VTFAGKRSLDINFILRASRPLYRGAQARNVLGMSLPAVATPNEASFTDPSYILIVTSLSTLNRTAESSGHSVHRAAGCDNRVAKKD